MPHIDCTYSCIKNAASYLSSDAKRVRDIKQNVVQIAMSLPLNTAVYRRLRRNIVFNVAVQMDKVQNNISKLGVLLTAIQRVYQHYDSSVSGENNNPNENQISALNAIDFLSEAALISALKAAMDSLGHLVDTSVYSSVPGQYGGDQGSARNLTLQEKRELYKIYRKNNPKAKKMSDRQFQNYLEKMNNEGCGYVALVNMMMNEYYGREEEFEKTFGYPMRDKNGNYNFNHLLVDLYSRMDNYDENGKYHKYNDRGFFEQGPIFLYDEREDRTGDGTNPKQRKYYFEQFLKEHGVTAHYETGVNVTVDNYKQIVKSGKTVCINYGYGIIRNENNQPHFINGGHSLVVTGVTDDGKFIVSSWGDKYILDPNETFTIENGKVISSVDGEHIFKKASANTKFRISYETAEIEK